LGSSTFDVAALRNLLCALWKPDRRGKAFGIAFAIKHVGRNDCVERVAADGKRGVPQR
jgi:hypothetical protein